MALTEKIVLCLLASVTFAFSAFVFAVALAILHETGFI